MVCSDMCEVNSGESCSLDFAICKLYGLKQGYSNSLQAKFSQTESRETRALGVLWIIRTYSTELGALDAFNKMYIFSIKCQIYLETIHGCRNIN